MVMWTHRAAGLPRRAYHLSLKSEEQTFLFGQNFGRVCLACWVSMCYFTTATVDRRNEKERWKEADKGETQLGRDMQVGGRWHDQGPVRHQLTVLPSASHWSVLIVSTLETTKHMVTPRHSNFHPTLKVSLSWGPCHSKKHKAWSLASL